MKTKTIVFDLDDTLIKEIDYLKSAFMEISRIVNSEDENLFQQMMNWYFKKENVFQNLVDLYPNNNIMSLRTVYRNHFPDFDSNTKVKEFLVELKERGFVLGLITDGYKVTQRNKIKALDIELLFDLIIISEEFGSEKPNLKNYEIFHQFDTGEYYYIGDNVNKDFITPNSLGWKTVCLIDNGSNIHKQDFEKDILYLPQISILNLLELNKHLKLLK